MPSPNKPSDFVEVFAAGTRLAAQKVMDVVLRPEGIDATLHDRADAMFPASGQPGGYYVAVPKGSAARAREVLEDALRNGYLDLTEGNLTPPRP